jgi:hypothetical protein
MLLIGAVFAIVVVTAMASLRRADQNISPAQAPQQVDEVQLPVADSAAQESADPLERARRKGKNKRYNNSGSRPIEDATYAYERIQSGHWSRGISAIPAAQSDVVLIGEVTDAHAYLSDDKTGVYSEFTILTGTALKNDSSNPLYPGGTITANRPGGAVRFPSGHIHKFKTSSQGSPRVGRQYLFFLKRTDQGQDFSIITGYELRGGRVAPLDGAGVEGGERLPFDEYNGADESAFLKTVQDAIQQALQSSSERRN